MQPIRQMTPAPCQRRAPDRTEVSAGRPSPSHEWHVSGTRLPLFLQPKLAISQPGDPSEMEADRVADQVMRMPEQSIQRQCAACEEEEAVTVSRKAEGTAAGEAPRSVHSTLRSPGQPLAASTRAFFEPRFGQDLSRVRVHTDPEAQQSAREVNALAYTVGSHVVFDAGQYAPHSVNGKRLLGHELTHVVQQSRGGDVTIQRQDAGLSGEEPFLVKLPPDGAYLKVTPSLTAENFPGDKAMNGDVVVIKNTGGAATYRKVKDGTWSWIEIPGRRSPDINYPTLHGFVETKFIANLDIGPIEEQRVGEPHGTSGGQVDTDDSSVSESNCRVDVRAVNPPVPIGNHLFIVASKENGVEYGYRGGPDVPGGLFALIETDVGRYEQGLFPDWDPTAQSVTVLSGAAACGMAECFSQKCSDIDAAEIGYEFYGPNSNSVVSQLLSSCGAPREKPDVWAPGWDVALFDSEP
jgi:Domain of unknown function (DUF4157)